MEKSQVNLDERNKARQAELDKMLKDGQLGTMTECAYGKAIGDTELNNKADLSLNGKK